MNQKLLIIFSLIIVLGVNSNGQEKDYQFIYSEQNVLDFYKYDKNLPLNARIDTMGTIDVYDSTLTFLFKYLKLNVQYESVHGERVKAKFWLPQKDSASSCILWLHGYGANKNIDDMVFGYIVGPSLGCAILALDAQYQGERKDPTRELNSLDLLQNRHAIAQTILDYRRGMDFLETVPAIDTSRIGLLGVSMGGIVGALLAGIDPRIKATVIFAGGGDWQEIFRLSDHKTMTPVRTYLKGNYSALSRLLEPVDPIRLIHRVKNLQMHHGTADMTVPFSTGLALFQQATDTSNVFYQYEGVGHGTNLEQLPVLDVLFHLIEWFQKHL